MTTSNKASLPLSGLFDIKDHVGTDHLVTIRSRSIKSKILECIIFIKLADFSGHSFLPQRVVIVLIEFVGFFSVAGDLDTKLMSHGMAFGVETGLVEHAS